MDKANENTYHATAQIAAPGIWLLNVSKNNIKKYK